MERLITLLFWEFTFVWFSTVAAHYVNSAIPLGSVPPCINKLFPNCLTSIQQSSFIRLYGCFDDARESEKSIIIAVIKQVTDAHASDVFFGVARAHKSFVV